MDDRSVAKADGPVAGAMNDSDTGRSKAKADLFGGLAFLMFALIGGWSIVTDPFLMEGDFGADPGPALVRYPRGTGPGVPVEPGLETLPIGKGELRREGAGVAILAFGSMLAPALQAGERLNASVANMRFVKPLDQQLVRRLAETHELLVTVEENAVQGGAGSAVGELLTELGLVCPLLHLGLPDRYVGQGSHAEQLRECGLDADGIAAAIRERVTREGAAGQQG